jgi:carbon-monoxide dehydrogenase medium subunit
MRPASFDFTQPTSLETALLAMRHDAVPMAGGQSLIQSLRLRRREPKSIVDLSRIEELSDEITLKGDHIRIGALVTHAKLMRDPLISRYFPWVADAASCIGDVQIRNMGTTVGNVCWADPRANMPVALLPSKASVVVVDPYLDGETRIPISAFFTGFQETVLLDRKLAISIEVPLPDETTAGVYLEQSRQRQDLALVNVCVMLGEGGIRAAVGGLYVVPVLIESADFQPSNMSPLDLAEALTQRLRGHSADLFWSPLSGAEYRFELAQVLLRRTIEGLRNAVHA